MLTDTGEIRGVRFVTLATGTFKVSLWDPDGTLVRTKTLAIGSTGEHDISFDTAYVVTDADLAKQERTGGKNWIVGVWDTAGASGQYTHYPANLTLFENNIGQPGLGVHHQSAQDWYATGDAKPTTHTGSRNPVDPLFVADSETYEPTPFSRVYGPNRTGIGVTGSNFTTGSMIIPIWNATIRGVRFYTQTGGDFRISLWDTSGTRIRVKDVSLGVGTHEVLFDSAYVFTDADVLAQSPFFPNYWAVSTLRTDVSGATVNTNVDFLEPATAAHFSFSHLHMPFAPFSYQTGDVWPNLQTGAWRVPIDPLIDLPDQNQDPWIWNLWNGVNAPGLTFLTSPTPDSCAGSHFLFVAPCTCTGVRFYTVKAGAHTINVRLWHPDGSSMASKDVACSGPGYYTGTFDTPVVITAAHISAGSFGAGSHFAVSTYVTDGSGRTVSTLRRVTTGHLRNDAGVLGRCVYYHDANAYHRSIAGNAKPQQNTDGVPIDPIVVPLLEYGDITPPYLANQDPAPSEPNVEVDHNVTLEILDDGAGVDAESVVIDVDGSTAWSGDAQQAGFAVTKTPISGGFEYVINPDSDFAWNDTILIEVYAEDIASNVLDTSYSFDTKVDSTAPALSNEDPPNSATLVPKDKVLSFDITDLESGIDVNTFNVEVEGATAYTGATDTFSSPYNGGSSLRSAITDGFNLAIDKTTDYDSYKLINVRVLADDIIGNSLDTTYSFRIEDYAAPVIDTNAPTGTGVAKEADVSFSTKDVGGAGIDSATINVVIDTVDAIINGVFQTGFDGVNSDISANAFNGYDVVIDKTTDWGEFATVDVTVDCDDLEGNSATQLNWNFQVEDYLGPLVIPASPTSGETGVSVTTNIAVRLTDADEVVLSTVLIEVDQGGGYATAYDGSAGGFQSGFSGPGSAVSGPADNRTFTIDPELYLPQNAAITIRVTAEDPTSNPERI
jgi:hypothetical protein